VIPALFVCAVIGARYLARRDDECSQHVQGEGTVTRRLCLLNKRLREAGVEVRGTRRGIRETCLLVLARGQQVVQREESR
jgi:hypothetical protein